MQGKSKNPIAVFFDNLIEHDHACVDGRWLPVRGFPRYEINELTHHVRRREATHIVNGVTYHWPTKYLTGSWEPTGRVFFCYDEKGVQRKVPTERLLALGLATAGMLP